MSAKDLFHQGVLIAIKKDGWDITHDPFYLKLNDIEFYIDLGAERLITAQRSGQKIAIEIKSFLGASAVKEFHLALGQFLNYRLALKQIEPERILYLAIPKDTYEDFFARQFVQNSVAEYKIKLMIFDPVKQEVVLWKE